MKCLWVLVFLVLSQGAGLCQGTMYKASEHHIGLLDFFNNHPFKNSNGKIPHPSPAANGMLNSKNGWYEEQGIKVRGLVESAALQVDWWMLFNEPSEQYEFQWVSSGKYDIQFTDSKGKPVSTTITRSQLEKYPDLLKRFNALQPTDMQFEIKWRIGDQTKADNDAFQKKYKLMGSIGSTLPHVKAEFTTQVKNSLLFEPSGIKPFATPSIRPGKGKAFLGVPATYDDKKLQQVFAYWRISLGHVINSFRVIKANWPVQEMKTIAEKFLQYEKGEADPTPKEVVATANEKNKNTPAYNKNDFWGDAMEEEPKDFIVLNVTSASSTAYSIKNKKTGETFYTSSNTITQISKNLFVEYSNSGHPDYIVTHKVINQKGNVQTINGKNSFTDFLWTEYNNITKPVFLRTLIKSTLIRKNVFQSRMNYASFESKNYSETYNYIMNYNGGSGTGSSGDLYIHEFDVIKYDASNRTVLEAYKLYSVKK